MALTQDPNRITKKRKGIYVLISKSFSNDIYIYVTNLSHSETSYNMKPTRSVKGVKIEKDLHPEVETGRTVVF